MKIRNKNPKVSVVLPCYNGEKFIRKAIESVIDQTYKNWELIIVDDGSTDNSKEVINHFLSDERVKYFRHPINRGIPATRNTGIRSSNGQYIAFLDQDDMWLSCKLRECLKAFKTSSEVGLVHTGLFMRKSNREIEISKSGYSIKGKRETAIQLFLGKAPFYSASAVMVNRRCFDNLGLMDERFYAWDDQEMWIRIITSGYQIICIEKPLVIKHMHKDNTSKNYKTAEDSIKLMNYLCEKYPFLNRYKNKRLSTIYYGIGLRYLGLQKEDSLPIIKEGRRFLKRAISYNRLNWRAYIIFFGTMLGKKGIKSLFELKKFLYKFRNDI